MNKDYNLIPIIVVWALVIIFNIWTTKSVEELKSANKNV